MLDGKLASLKAIYKINCLAVLIRKQSFIVGNPSAEGGLLFFLWEMEISR